eukprot:3885445-Rhodomonas_salina.1
MCVEDGSVECDACIVFECGDDFGVAVDADWFGDGCALYKCRESVVFCSEPVGSELCGCGCAVAEVECDSVGSGLG